MKKYLLISFLLITGNVFSQNNNIDILSPKPRISVNGVWCNIQYAQFSCVPVVCDTVFVSAGDTINFCSVPYYTELNYPGYWLHWNFPGSNLPYASDTFPEASPICYNTSWTVPGNYTVTIYYFGALAASCNNVPSEWIVNVVVAPVAGVEEKQFRNEFQLFPVPANNEFSIIPKENKNYTITIMNSIGQEIFKSSFQNETHISTTDFPEGIYFIKISDDKENIQYSEKLIINH